METSRWTRWILGAAIVLAITVVVGLAAGWLAFQHIPSWYDPPQVQAADLPRIRASLPGTYQEFTDLLAGGGVFEFKLAARTVNEWIAARADLWPDARDVFPPWVREPVVAFTNHRIILAARCKRDEVEGIVSAHFAVNVNGDELLFRLTKLATGSLALPMTAVIDALDRRLADLPDLRGSLPNSLQQFADELGRLESIGVLRDGWMVANDLYWSNGRRRFRLLEVRCENGDLILRVETQ